MRIMRGTRGLGRGLAGLGIALAIALASGAGPPRPEDDRTFRPTVLIRKGTAQGSGTVIASTDGETLVLTAAHVVQGPGPLRVELHRYNLGIEGVATRGDWPRSVGAEVVAADRAADLAILRIRRMVALPFVARIGAEDSGPSAGTVVTSVGIDLGTRLSAWSSWVAEVDRFEIEGSGAERDFVITARPPEHGRSGGGLFLEGGELVGVCIGRAEIVKGRRLGVFASGASVRRLLREHALDARVVPPPDPLAVDRRRPPIVPTRSRPAR